jgi:hypothetical protein
MRTLGQFVGLLLLAGFVGAYFWWIVVTLAAAGLAWLAVRSCGAAQAQAAELAARNAELVARADRQHQRTLVGDVRGVYGEYPPASCGTIGSDSAF